MPLPNLNAQCTANNRKTGKRCKNPAAYGCKTCRYHGARRNILKGIDHPNYKHGKRTKESIATYSYKVAELDHLEAIAHLNNIRWRRYEFMRIKSLLSIPVPSSSRSPVHENRSISL